MSSPRTARHLGLFFAGAALIFVVIGAVLAHRQERRLATYVEAEAEIVSGRIDTWQTTSKGRTSTHHRPVIEYDYVVGGRTYRSEQLGPTSEMGTSSEFADRVLAQFPVGTRHPCWHDPDDPGDAFLLRETSFMPYLFVVIGSPFLAMGLLLVGLSVELGRARLGATATTTMAVTFAFVVGHYRGLAGGTWSTLAKVGVGIHVTLLVPTAIVSSVLALRDRR